jgi:asparagine synthase (glutamine-hydrolysing)
MCGIAGFKAAPAPGHKMEEVARAMADRVIHRGPDDSGTWVDAGSGIALAHRRLSILDLSPAGHQPMHAAGGRYVLVFNGEVYNHLQLRQQLLSEGHALEWRGHSDTETLLACIEAWGLERALQASVGMFALALWDRSRRLLQLARDRIGEKPLYYGWQRDTFLFGSELKALAAHPGVFNLHGYTPYCRTFYVLIRRAKLSLSRLAIANFVVRLCRIYS